MYIERQWSISLALDAAKYQKEGLSIVPRLDLTQILISGLCASAPESIGNQFGTQDFRDVQETASYAVCLGRESILSVGAAHKWPLGQWQDEGWFGCDVSAAFVVFDICGNAMRDMVSEATTLNLDHGSRSASTIFADVPAILYRSSGSGVRLHVDRGFATHVWTWMTSR